MRCKSREKWQIIRRHARDQRRLALQHLPSLRSNWRLFALVNHQQRRRSNWSQLIKTNNSIFCVCILQPCSLLHYLWTHSRRTEKRLRDTDAIDSATFACWQHKLVQEQKGENVSMVITKWPFSGAQVTPTHSIQRLIAFQMELTIPLLIP